ncbi:MerR family transcriptional regulator [Flavobacterium sp. MAH-1]|uniref:MerR family transcriptional regulator n=1 Tax=Flavobacterium agri TaxID=2743471 RepID=A0A7Y9C636_9FLAO|nr:MerR family transcriptional regulator [Flavobacterium agri]NUY81932.1 MerR family transcriptional regulator [Flavobacterium agri]NYA71956.1 MerR family transcriptional regulator [Flavobacterium agri]
MNNIKSVFSIKDLENLSDIKAHTIRIWEKRYSLLSPLRTDANTRYYDIENLQKLLNVVLLVKYGFKLHRLALLNNAELDAMVKEVRTDKYDRNHVSHLFKVAMMTFDQHLFMQTYQELLREKTFRQVFFDYFMPLLEDIGILWQTRTITPAHEHFISCLIRMKIIANTDSLLSGSNPAGDHVYALFLPLDEIHELGLLYLNYALLESRHRTIYLGESMPIESLERFKSLFNRVTFVTYATVSPSKLEFSKYLEELRSRLLSPGCELWVLGSRVQDQDAPVNPAVKFFPSLKDVLNEL